MKLIKKILLMIVIFIMLYPFIYITIGMTQDAGWAFRNDTEYWFGDQFKNNLFYITAHFDFLRIIMNSLIVALSTAMISTIVVFLAAYAVNKYEFKYKRLLLMFFATSIFIPQSSILIGNLKTISYLGIYGSIVGIIIPFIINIRVYVYLYQLCFYVPNDLMEAGRIDGATEFKIMKDISIPVIKDKIIFSFFMLFVSSWNNFLIPMIMISKGKNYTLPVLISSLADPLSYNTGSTFLALSISILPLIILFVLLSKKIFEIDSKY